VTHELEQTGMAVTTDLGNMKDIHFTRKKEVGERLAFIALARNYGYNDIVFTGPVVKKMNIEKAGIRLQFDQKLMTTDKKEAGGFEIGYRDDKTDSVIFVKTRARIEGDKIILSADQASKPVAIRYAWLEIADANIINISGLPAAPFSKKLNN
jgi:sialate O-acetylesterase